MAMQSLSAQNYAFENREGWIDLQIVQHIGLSKWSDISYINDGLPPPSMTEVRAVFNYEPFILPSLGAFVDMGLGIMPAPEMKSFDFSRMPMPNSGTQYYLREMISESGIDKTSAHFKITAGLFGDFEATEKLNIMPYFGVGGLSMPYRKYEMILKEDGSNMQYNTTYVWSKNSGEGHSSEMLGYLTGRLNFRYKISPKSSLLLGLEYTYFFDTTNFYGKYSNTFNGNVQRSFEVKGNNMNMLSVSAGISFR